MSLHKFENMVSYAESCRLIAEAEFSNMDISAVAEIVDDYNAYPNLDDLEEAQNIILIEERVDENLRQKAKEAILEGLILWEHTAAGEATRLKLGSKYLINPNKISLTNQSQFSNNFKLEKFLSLNLGSRHLLQLIFEIENLAASFGLNPWEVIRRQKNLLIVNEESQDEICSQIINLDFMGLKAENFLFMVQPFFRGLTCGAQGWQFDENTAKHLHNHGQMAMQKTMDRQIFYLNEKGTKYYLSREDFFEFLNGLVNLVSYNIEDLNFLNHALDFDTLALAISLADENYGMLMEIVANNPACPIKGGLCAFDPHLGRNVMIENFRLKDFKPEDIKYLNKNFNHYPKPALAFKELSEKGLFMPLRIINGALYFQPVQGDLNFLVKTAFIRRKKLVPLKSWKSAADTPAALEAMLKQDSQPGFVKFLQNKAIISASTSTL